ncbi:TIR domain-containing protein [uncultured Roseibium sp.]|uniref:toll/interleukin-1 receptor domain-containing protein n=1 Tax=uncultured Roseibium sp. TaxID=1936171 RepID=UPI003216487E
MEIITEEYEYCAFVSYRHLDQDRKWAKWLLDRIERFRTPRALRKRNLPARLGKVFRDEDEIPASSDLSHQIRDALRKSEYLIVVCSPETPLSRWVCEEIRQFHALGRSDKIIALLIDGEPETSFPAPLTQLPLEIVAGEVTSWQDEAREPIAANVLPRTDISRKELERNEFLRIAACLLGVKYDDLKQRDEERRRTRMWYVIAASLAGALVASGLSALAVQQRNIAVTQRAEARKQLRTAQISQSRFLLEKAETTLEAGSPNSAIRIALAGLPSAKDAPGDRPLVSELYDFLPEAYDRQHDIALLDEHSDIVNAVAYSPDGLRLVSASTDETAILRESATGIPYARLTGHADMVTQVSFSPDSSTVLTASHDGTARLWDSNTGEMQAILKGHTGAVNKAVFSPDGLHCLTVSEDGSVRIWNAENGSQIGTISFPDNGVFDAAFAGDGSEVVTASGSGEGERWTLEGERISIFSVGLKQIDKVVFSPNGQSMLTLVLGSRALIWRTDKMNLPKLLKEEMPESWFAGFSADGKLLTITTTQEKAGIWNTETGELVAMLPGKFGKIRHAVFNRAGTRLATGSSDNRVRIFDAGSGDLLATFSEHTDSVWNVAFSPDGKRVASASDDETVRLWRTETGNFSARVIPHASEKLFAAFDTRTDALVVARDSGGIELRSAETGALLREPKPVEQGIVALKKGPYGLRLISRPLNGVLSVFDGVEGSKLATIEAGDAEIYESDISFNHDATQMALATDRRVRIWDLDTGELASDLPRHETQVYSARFSPDGTQLVTTTEGGTVRLWDLDPVTEVRSYDGHEEYVHEAVFHPDGDRFVTWSNENSVWFWNTDNAEPVSVFRTTSTLRNVEFSPDGTLLAMGNSIFRTPDGDDNPEYTRVRLKGGEDVTRVKFLFDGKYIIGDIAGESKSAARIWNASSGETVAGLRGYEFRKRGNDLHFVNLHSFDISRNNKKILTVSDQFNFQKRTYSVLIWDTARLLRTYDFILLSDARRFRDLSDAEMRWTYQEPETTENGANDPSWEDARDKELIALHFARPVLLDAVSEWIDKSLMAEEHFRFALLSALGPLAGVQGGPEEPNHAQALKHFAIASGLFQAEGRNRLAAATRKRQAAVARNMPDADVARTWLRARKWLSDHGR